MSQGFGSLAPRYVRGLVAQPSAQTKPDLCHRDLLHLYNNLTTYLTLIHSAIPSDCVSLINLSLHTIMLRASKETEAYRKDAKHNHNLLGKEEREKLLQVRYNHPLYLGRLY